MAYTKQRNIAPFGLRMQPEIRKALEDAAKGRPNWSLNAEIVERLEQSLAYRRELDAFSDGEMIDELARRWGRDAVYIRLGKDK